MRFSSFARRRPEGRHYSGPAMSVSRPITLRVATGVLGLALVAGLGAGGVVSAPIPAQASTPEATVAAADPANTGVASAKAVNAPAASVDDATPTAGATPAEGDAPTESATPTETPAPAEEAATVEGPAADSSSDAAVPDRSATKSRSLALAALLTNPQLPAKCGLSVAVVLDLSNSLLDSDVAASKTAAKGVVTSLRGTPSSVGVYTFATFAPDTRNIAIARTSVSTTSAADGVNAKIDQIKRVPSNVGGTNWDAALRQIPKSTYDIVLFVTDGNPTAYGTPNSNGWNSTPRNNTDFGSGFQDIDLDTAVTAADNLKTTGAFVMGLAVGAGINLPNIKAISGTRSGTDYFQISNYTQLTAQLTEIALKNCQGTVSIVKQVRDLAGNLSPAAGWSFTGRTVDNVAPGSAVTGTDGAVNFKVNDLSSSGRTVQFAESQKPGHMLELQKGANATCVNNVTGKNVATTNAGQLGFAVKVNLADAISCEVINKMIPSTPIVTKVSDPVSGTEVNPGQTVRYSLSFGNEGFFPAQIDHVDHLGDVLDDAVFNNDIRIAGAGLTAVRAGETIKISGAVAPGETVTVAYSVTVKTKSFGNGVARNFLVPKGIDPSCGPAKDNCTEHPIPGVLTTKKTSDPESGSYVSPGSKVKYSLSFANSGASAVTVNHVDFLMDVLDDAEFTVGSLLAGSGLAAALDGDKIRITGSVKPESITTVTYSVQVKTSNFGNGKALNFLVKDGENPPKACEPVTDSCTEHPILGSLSWDKVDDNGRALAGSEWELTGPGTSASRSIKDCIADSASACLGPDLDPAAGGFALGGLAWGDYTLRESLAPAGYVKDSTEHRISITGGNSPQLVVHLDPIANEQQQAFALPLTGGTGQSAYMFVGGGLILLAIVTGLWTVARRIKSKRT